MLFGPKNRTRAVVVAGVILLAPPAAYSQAPPPGAPSPPKNYTEQVEPYLYTSNLGLFQVMMPGGCAQVRKREKGGPDSPGGSVESVTIRMVTCDYNQEKGRGVAVTSVFNMKNPEGGDPGPDEVLQWVTNSLQQFGVVVRKQTSVSKDFPGGLRVEGVDVRAVQEKGKGEFWIRGLLSGSDIFILAAWDIDGNLWDNAEYQQFFNSFTPLAR